METMQSIESQHASINRKGNIAFESINSSQLNREFLASRGIPEQTSAFKQGSSIKRNQDSNMVMTKAPDRHNLLKILNEL